MTEKEKLMKLLEDGQTFPGERDPFDKDCDCCRYLESKNCFLEKLADHLIANCVALVVHCKDCKWGTTPYGDEHDGWTECTNLCGRPLMPDGGFCSYGERRNQ